MRYHHWIWRRYFKRYIDHVHDSRPNLPRWDCWSISCWMRRNKFKRYWNWRAPIPIEGKNSSPFLHRRCRIPGTHGRMCRREHLRHDYFWRMFMWIGRYGFPRQPERKRICITDYCRFQKRLWKKYWEFYWQYTSLIPVIRPFDFRWKFWMWRFAGNPMRLQQVIAPALIAIGQGGILMSGNMNHFMMMGMGGRGMSIEMKQALLGVMQRNLAESSQVAAVASSHLQRQRMALMMLMRIPAFPSAVSAQFQMQAMMRNMQYAQMMQQHRMQMALQHQIWSMAHYLRGSCGCRMCAGGTMAGPIPAGASMYLHHGGMVSPLNPGGIYGAGIGGGMGLSHLPVPTNPVQNPVDLEMRVRALYARNNLPHY